MANGVRLGRWHRLFRSDPQTVDKGGSTPHETSHSKDWGTELLEGALEGPGPTCWLVPVAVPG